MKINNEQRKLLRKRAKYLMSTIVKDMMHDSRHINRTLEIAKQIYKSINKQADWDLIEQTVLWHDISRINNQGTGILMFYFDDLLSVKIVKTEFKKLNIDDYFTRKVCKLIMEHRLYSRGGKTLAGQIVRDADKIDMYSPERYDIATACVVDGLSKRNYFVRDFVVMGMNIYLFLCMVIYRRTSRALNYPASRKIYYSTLKDLLKYFNHVKNTDKIIFKFIKRRIKKRIHDEIKIVLKLI
jgi:hypothetical protein